MRTSRLVFLHCFNFFSLIAHGKRVILCHDLFSDWIASVLLLSKGVDPSQQIGSPAMEAANALPYTLANSMQCHWYILVMCLGENVSSIAALCPSLFDVCIHYSLQHPQFSSRSCCWKLQMTVSSESLTILLYVPCGHVYRYMHAFLF